MSLYFFMSSSPSGDVFIKTRIAPEVEARRKKKAEMRAAGYIGHGQYRRPLSPDDPDYKEQLEYIRKGEEMSAKIKAKRDAMVAAGELPDVPDPHAAGHGHHGGGGPQGGVMSFLKPSKHKVADLPMFVWHNIIYGDMNDKREADLEIEVPFVSPLSSCFVYFPSIDDVSFSPSLYRGTVHSGLKYSSP